MKQEIEIQMLKNKYRKFGDPRNHAEAGWQRQALAGAMRHAREKFKEWWGRRHRRSENFDARKTLRSEVAELRALSFLFWRACWGGGNLKLKILKL